MNLYQNIHNFVCFLKSRKMKSNDLIVSISCTFLIWNKLIATESVFHTLLFVSRLVDTILILKITLFKNF